MIYKLGLIGSPTQIYTPTDFRISMNEIVREQRTASGKLVKDVIATKRVFSLTYNALKPEQVNVLLTEKNRNQFLEFEYPDGGEQKKAIVWFGEIDRTRLLKGIEIWKNFSFILEEQ